MTARLIIEKDKANRDLTTNIMSDLQDTVHRDVVATPPALNATLGIEEVGHDSRIEV